MATVYFKYIIHLDHIHSLLLPFLLPPFYYILFIFLLHLLTEMHAHSCCCNSGHNGQALESWNQPGYPYRILTIEQFWAKKATAVETVADGVRPEG